MNRTSKTVLLLAALCSLTPSTLAQAVSKSTLPLEGNGTRPSQRPETSCEEKRSDLKARALAAATPERLKSVLNPKYTEGSSREHKWDYVREPAKPGKVGGRTEGEIDKMGCDEIEQMYGRHGPQQFVNGYAMTPDGRLGGREERPTAIAPRDGPSLVAPGAKPDLKTGEYPKPIDPNLSDEQWIEVFKNGFGNGPEGFKGGALDAAVAAAQGALAAGADRGAAAEAGFNAGYAAMPRGNTSGGLNGEPPAAKGSQKEPSKYQGSVGIPKTDLNLLFGVGESRNGLWTGFVGLEAGVGGDFGASISEDGSEFEISAGPFGFSKSRDFVEPGVSAEVNGNLFMGKGGSASAKAGPGGVDVDAKRGAGFAAKAGGQITIGFAPDFYKPLKPWYTERITRKGRW